MPFFAKVLLFFSVPVLMFTLFAVPSLRRSEPGTADDAWRSLADGGLQGRPPAGWSQVDPLLTSTPIPGERWMMGWPARDKVHAGAFLAPQETAQFTVFVGPSTELLPLVDECSGYYLSSVMVKREPALRVQAAGGLDFQVERARYLPGPLTGTDSTRLLAWANRGERTILVNGGGPTETLTQAQIERFLRGLTLVNGE